MSNKISSKNSALIVLDFINDIVHPEGKIAASAALIAEQKIIEKANKTISFARKHHLPIIFVKVGFNHYAECPENSPIFSRAKQLQALQLNTWGTEFHEELDVNQNDLVIIKHRISAFYATSLEAILRAKNIQQVIIIGVSTDMAVQITAREAHDRDYQVVVVSDACATASAALHESTINALQKIAQIITVDEL